MTARIIRRLINEETGACFLTKEINASRQQIVLLLLMFTGIFCGGYHYSLKMYTYERVRARNFARTWGFVQCSQAIPIVIGVPFSGKICCKTLNTKY